MRSRWLWRGGVAVAKPNDTVLTREEKAGWRRRQVRTEAENRVRLLQTKEGQGTARSWKR